MKPILGRTSPDSVNAVESTEPRHQEGEPASSSPFAATDTVPDWPFRAPAPLGHAPSTHAPSTPPTAPITFAVVITAYNVGPFVGEAIESVLGQSRSPEQLIVVDDGSTDETAQEIARFGAAVSLIQQENAGEGAAKNAGWRAATTDFVVFLDGDDRFAPQRIEAMHWLATKRRDLDILVTDLVEFGPGARVVPPMSTEFVVRDPLGAVLDHNTISVPAIRRSLLDRVGGMGNASDIHRDWELAVRLVLAGGQIGVISQPLYEYRRWAGQVTADELRVIDMDLRTLDAIDKLDALSDAERATLQSTARDIRVRQWRVGRQTATEHGEQSEQLAARFIVHTPEYPWGLRLRARASLLVPRLVRRVATLRRRAVRV